MITGRIDAITAVSGPYAQPVVPTPRAVKVELTSRCDLSCAFCLTGQRLSPRGDMEWPLLHTVLARAREAGVQEVGLFYLGESFLYPRLAEAIALARQHYGFPYVFLTTNGRLATPERLGPCVTAGLDSLKVSLNAGGAEAYRRLTGVDGFAAVVANIKGARRVIDDVYARTGHRCRLYVSTVVGSTDDREGMRDILAEIAPYLDERYELPVHGHAAAQSGASPSGARGAIGRLAASRAPLPCWPVFTLPHIRHDGRISVCCWDNRDVFALADLTSTSLMDAWNGAPIVALRRAHLAGDVQGTICETCIHGIPADAPSKA